MKIFIKNNGLDYAIQIEEFANGKVELKYKYIIRKEDSLIAILLEFMKSTN